MTNLVVKQHRPLQLLLTVVVISLVISTTIWLFLDESHWEYIEARLDGNQQAGQMWQINRQLEQENRRLKDRVLMLEQTAEIDKQASTHLREQVVNLQDQFYKLKAELEFYKEILSATQHSQGLNVQGLYIEALAMDQTYRYRLVLTNVAKNDQEVEGVIRMTLEGNMEGVRKTLNVSDLAGSAPGTWNYTFRNFKRFEGDIKLPAGFIPQRVTVQLSPKGSSGRGTVEKSFDWPDLTS
ncbi:MAG: DUF6776 family protein [Gammaproteobacteria bacterium]|nr:DUF6776 family protein [Gammaproteobacteria bacterium]